MAAIPTIPIDRNGERVLINASSFDPKTHTRWGTVKEPIEPEDTPSFEEKKKRVRKTN